MPIIAIKVGQIDHENKFKISEITAWVTQEKYDEYMKNREINITIHTIPTFYLTEYITRHHHTIDEIHNFDLPSEEKKQLRDKWTKLNVLDVGTIIKLFKEYGLSYPDFIDEYCAYLKTII